ncbi:MAG: hypothetical protein AAF416_00555 [Pseudomonadota bacterium]
MKAYLEDYRGAVTIDWVAFTVGMIVVALGLVDLASEEGGALVALIEGEGLAGLFNDLAPTDD